MEVERWVREGLVDVLLVGMGHLPSRLRLDQFVSLGRAHGVPVYATLNGNSYRAGGLGRALWPARVSGGNARQRRLLPPGGRGRHLPLQLRQRADPGAEPRGVRFGPQRIGGGGDPGGQEQDLRHPLHGPHRRAHHPGVRVGPAAGGPGSGGDQAAAADGTGRRPRGRPLSHQSLDRREPEGGSPLGPSEPHPASRPGPGGALVSRGGAGRDHAQRLQRVGPPVGRPGRGGLSPESLPRPASSGRTGWVGSGTREPWWRNSPRAGWCGNRGRKGKRRFGKGVP